MVIPTKETIEIVINFLNKNGMSVNGPLMDLEDGTVDNSLMDLTDGVEIESYMFYSADDAIKRYNHIINNTIKEGN